jgi:hypothetical protein
MGKLKNFTEASPKPGGSTLKAHNMLANSGVNLCNLYLKENLIV